MRARLRAAALATLGVLGAWAALLVLHAPLLRLPYYWDEAGYYVPAAYDFFRTGALIPHSTLTNAHPPLFAVILAAAWKLFGFSPLVTRCTAALMAGIALAGVYFLSRNYLPRSAAFAVAALTAVYPVWFSQSVLAHADIFAAAFTLAALAVFSRTLRPSATTLLLFCAAVLSKETAIVTPAALAAWSLWEFAASRRWNRLRDAALWLTPALPLAAWYFYHRSRTGFMFGNPEFLRYNALGTWHAGRIVFAVVQRAWHLGGHMELFVPLLFTLVLWLIPYGPDSTFTPHRRRLSSALTVIFVANALFFSVAGGALLTRYLLPLYALVLLFHVLFWSRRTRLWPWLAAVSAVAFVVGWTVNPPYGFAAEDNLAWRDSVVLAQQAIAQLPPPQSVDCVLTAWPLSSDLRVPELGYVAAPYTVSQMDDVTLRTLMTRAQNSPHCGYAVLFSSNPDPGDHAWSLRGRAAETNRAYFGAHDSAPPEFAARLLGLKVLWQQRRRGQWIAVLGNAEPVLDARVR